MPRGRRAKWRIMAPGERPSFTEPRYTCSLGNYDIFYENQFGRISIEVKTITPSERHTLFLVEWGDFDLAFKQLNDLVLLDAVPPNWMPTKPQEVTDGLT